MTRLEGKTALITGGAGGIGAAAGRVFLDAGAAVLLADRDEDALHATQAELAAAARERDMVAATGCDVTDPEAMQRAVDTAGDRFGGLDIAVLNAGIEGTVAPIADTPLSDFDRVMEVNLRGVFIGLQCVIPALRVRGGGSILMTSSVAGVIGTAGLAPYTASKHALIGLMRSAALETAEDAIRVNTVNPCSVETRMMRSLEQGFSPEDPGETHRALEASIPLKRYAAPEDVAAMLVFLASDEARFLTGGVYMVDGGMTAGLVRA